jgi:predicted dehydrogenase
MKKISLGIIGCGAVSQVQHLPNLMHLRELFSVDIVCDRSPGLANWAAGQFNVAQKTCDYRDVLDSPVEAVLLCHTDPKTQVAVEAFAAGKHVFIEKPVCFSLEEMDRILSAQQQASTVGQAGYMKVYDPAFEMAQRRVQTMDTVRYVQSNHLHVDNKLHLAQLNLVRFDDLPGDAIDETRQARAAAVTQAIGTVDSDIQAAFSHLAGSAIHDLYGLRTLFGVPEKVVSTEVWYDGWGLHSVLQYANDVRCAYTWVELPKLWDFRESLEVYGDDCRVLLSYPSGFSPGIPSTLVLQGIDAEGTSYRQEPAIPWDNAFTNELRHFHACVTQDQACRTPLDEAKHDIALIIDMVKAFSP